MFETLCPKLVIAWKSFTAIFKHFDWSYQHFSVANFANFPLFGHVTAKVGNTVDLFEGSHNFKTEEEK